MLIYFFHRIRPFLILFLGIEFLVRLAFLVKEWAYVDTSACSLAKTFAIGWVMDLTVFLYFLIPLALYLLALPRKYYGGPVDRWITAAFYFAMTFILLFTSLSEWFFWDELGSRFNFIAVDYLVYTHEVIGNIRESYPLPLLIAGIALVSALGTALFFRQKIQRPQISCLSKIIVLICALCFPVLGYFAVPSSLTESSPSRYMNELSKNGIYELFSAFFNNELPLEKFYITGSPAANLKRMRAHLNASQSAFLDDGLTRRIQATGPEKRYNIALITVESLSADYMAAFGNTQNLTPYLDELARQSLFFTNLRAIGRRTVYGLAGITLSIPPLPGNAIVRRPGNDHLFTLGSVLQERGYACKFIYGGYGYFDNMNAFFAGNGYQCVDRADLSRDEITFANIWGVCDEDLLRRVLKENDEAYAKGQPFFDMVMTTSNHRPFTYPEGKIDIPPRTGRTGGVKYTDYAIGQFIESARAKPWFKDTIFVIIADHTAGSGGKLDLEPERYHIPCIIYAPYIPEVEAGRVVEGLCSQIDLAPTLLGLLNLSYTSKFYGVDLLKTALHRALISNYQQIGYLTDDELIVFRPVKQVQCYKREGSQFVLDNGPHPGLIADALSYYQCADNWKTWNKEALLQN